VLRLLYTLLTVLALPLIFGRLWWRGRRYRDYRRRWAERLGFYRTAPVDGPSVVFHAVSVGEVHAAMPLLEAWLQRHPEQSVVVTTTTPTGSARVRQLLGKRVKHVYLPYDLPWCVAGFIRQFNPKLVVLMETELWPNLLHGCRQHQCPVLLVSARLSPKSFASYQVIGSLSRTMLQQLALVAAQSGADGERFVRLGLPPERLVVAGSFKFDISIQTEKLAAARQIKALWQRPVWIAASTRAGEEALVLSTHKQMLAKIPDLLLVLVPRHPERFPLAQELASARGLSNVKQSSAPTVTAATKVLVGDTLGDMHFYYGLSDVAFVGGSLVATGCQNIIEAAAFGLPVLTGPSLYNFQAASDELRSAGAMQVVADAAELGKVVVELLQNDERRLHMGQKAKAVVAANLGATLRTLELIERYGFNH
jgi:3-deoxy-D-manno-octulosonic-acid transferase